MMRNLPLVALMSALCGWLQDPERPYNTYLGKPVPALTGGKEDWLNVREAPTLDGVKGRAVLVVFTSIF